MFGELKSKIEIYLSESYKKGTLKDNNRPLTLVTS